MEKTATEDEMVRWHHQFNEHELGQTPGDGEVPESMRLPRIGHDLATEQQQQVSDKYP